MSPSPAPKVSIGLPVYNGEKYLGAAIESILGQTHRDFELIISDNASADSTEAICRRFAASDERIVYRRQERNIGLGPNHNFCVREARGEYFRWGSHDDLLEPEYLARTVALLDATPDAVLCHSLTRVIGEKVDPTHGAAAAVPTLAGVDSTSASERFRAIVLRPHWCTDIYGLMRRSALLQTNLLSGYFGGDKTLLAEMALRGRFVHVPETLFLNRDHPGRSMRAVPFHKRQQFHDTSSVRRRVTHWALYTDYWRAVGRHVTDPAEQRRCYAALLRWWTTNLHSLRVVMDVLYVTLPGVAVPMYRLREAYHRRGIGVAQSK
jgi:glycosyltransferase involved in cell wall biosynthesis